MVRRFRHCAARALMILRDYKGHEISVNKQQINAQILLQVCKGLPRFPVVEETFREILEDDMDLEHVKEVLEEIGRGEKKFILLPRCDVPSPFAHGLLLVGMSDVILMESRREILERFHKMVMERISS
jgi:ATP-dependent Lhr-like helicase